MGIVADVMRKRWTDGGSSGGWLTAGSGTPPVTFVPAVAGYTHLWDPTDPTQITPGTGSLVAGLADKGSVPVPLSQGAPVNQPTTGGTIGTKNALAYTLSGSNLAGTGGIGTAFPITVIGAVQLATGNTANNQFIGNTVTSPTVFTSASLWSYYAGTSQSGTLAIDTNAHDFVAIFDGASSALYIDGVIVSTANPGATLNPFMLLGSSGNPFAGKLGPVIVYQSHLTDAQRFAVTAGLRAWMGLTAFSPFAIPWSGAYWADDPSWAAKPANGGNITTWRDGSPVALDITASGAPTPTWVQSVALLNNKGAVSVAPGGIIGVGAGAPTPAQPLSTVFLGTVDAVAGASNANILSTGGGTTLSVQTGTSNFGMFAGTNAFPGVGGIGAHGVRALFNGASSALNIDGTNNVTSAGANADTAVRWVNSFTGATNQGGTFRIGFVGHYAGDVTTDPAWPTFKAWAASYYGLTIA